jgi:hypothetical protein
MRYDKPQTVYVRAKPVDIAKPLLDEKPTPRIVPDLNEFLQSQIAGCIDIHDFKDGTHLYALMFAWPTHEDLQVSIAFYVAELCRKGTAWMRLDDLPKQDVEVTETVADTAKPKVDGVYTTKSVQVLKPMAVHAAKFCFVGDLRAAAAVKVEEVEPLQDNFVKQ